MNQEVSRDHSHILALDGIRGLAVLAVTIGHTWINPLPGNPVCNFVTRFFGPSWIGVDLFFVLSGFLITGILYRSTHAENFFRVFYFRRFLRISPLYYGVLFALILLTYPLHIQWHGRQWIFLLYLQNTGIKHGIFSAPFSPYVTLSHFWSLAVEEQFYLVWPLLIFLIRDLKKLIPLTIFLSICALLLRTVLMMHHANPWVLYMSVATRADSLMIGALLALLLRSSNGVRLATLKAAPYIFSGAAFPLALLWVHYGNISGLDPLTGTIGYSLLAVLWASLIAMALSVRQVQAILSLSPLRWFGRYSYGIYVYHPFVVASCLMLLPPIISHLTHTELLQTFWSRVISVPIALTTAYLSFQLYENPILQWKSRMKYRFPAVTKGESSARTTLTGTH